LQKYQILVLLQKLFGSLLLPENVTTSILEKRLTLATRKNERNEKKIQFSIQSTDCDGGIKGAGDAFRCIEKV
jgi:hypothetical protein